MRSRKCDEWEKVTSRRRGGAGEDWRKKGAKEGEELETGKSRRR